MRARLLLLASVLPRRARPFSIHSPAFCHGYKIQHIQHEPDNNILAVQWNDGKTGRYPYVWLRDCSPDPSTYSISESMVARRLFMHNFDVEVRPKSVHTTDDGAEMLVEWPCGTKSRYSAEWLRTRNLGDEETRKWRRKAYLTDFVSWGSADIAARLHRFPYRAVMDTDRALHDFLHAVCVDGIALIYGSPLDERGTAERGVVHALGQRIGLIQQTHFGRIFEVSTKPDASNMAYASTGELPLHADFPSLSHPPELQMLHMIERAESGGVSLFVDGFRVAEQLEQEFPEAFRLLTTKSLEYIEEGFDVHTPAHESATAQPVQFDYDMAARHKVISLDANGRPSLIRFGNAMRSWFYDMDVEEILPMYRAMKLFVDQCYQPRNLFRLQLENGDVVLWANTRLLHSRTAFHSPMHRSRILEGCYFGWDFIRSKIRVLRDSLNLPENQPSA